jgi:vacuolar-type H+-ATPase subunit I/STV1
MNTSKHMKIAGVLQLLQGLLFLLGGTLYTIALISDLQTGVHELNDSWSFFLVLAVALFMGTCQVCFGLALVMRKQWATRVSGFICCAIGLPFIPFGTAISAYTLWVLIMVRGEDAKVPQPINGEVREKAGGIE